MGQVPSGRPTPAARGFQGKEGNKQNAQEIRRTIQMSDILRTNPSLEQDEARQDDTGNDQGQAGRYRSTYVRSFASRKYSVPTSRCARYRYRLLRTMEMEAGRWIGALLGGLGCAAPARCQRWVATGSWESGHGTSSPQLTEMCGLRAVAHFGSLSLTHTPVCLSPPASSGFLQRLRLRMRGRRRRRDHTGGEEREGGQDSSPVVDVDLFPSLSLQVDVGPGTYTTWTEVTALLAPDVAPVDRHKVRPINCHDQDPGGPPTYPALFADPWPGCGHRLLASPFRNSSNEHACTPPHLCLAHFFLFFFLSSPALSVAGVCLALAYGWHCSLLIASNSPRLALPCLACISTLPLLRLTATRAYRAQITGGRGWSCLVSSRSCSTLNPLTCQLR